MRSANGDTSTSLWVGIFSAGSASTAVPATAGVPFASFARSAWLVDAERATEKNRKTGTGSFGGRNLLEHHDETGLLARLMQWLGHAVVQRIKVLAEMRREDELPGNQVEH